jgi:hypothetical protein
MLIPFEGDGDYTFGQLYTVARETGYGSQAAFMDAWIQLSDMDKRELVEMATGEEA